MLGGELEQLVGDRRERFELSPAVRARCDVLEHTSCTSEFCLSLWTPLVVVPGTKPTGAKLLATVKRPDGRTQVTYRGGPLYSFTQDRKPGDVKGNGFKDVGVWLAASPKAKTTATPPPSSGGYGGLYG